MRSILVIGWWQNICHAMLGRVGNMWKDSYATGVDEIDKQHKSLCHAVQKLLTIIEGDNPEASKQECIDTILFLKDYAIKHFVSEELYMTSINFPELEKHRLMHNALGHTVGIFEKKMVDEDFSVTSIKEFAGFVMAWLAYHMAEEDQKFVNYTGDDKNVIESGAHLACLTLVACGVLVNMAHLETQEVYNELAPADADSVCIVLKQLRDGGYQVAFSFSAEAALGLFEALSLMRLNKVNELAYATLSEIASTINNRALSMLMSTQGQGGVVAQPQVQVFKEGQIPDNSDWVYIKTNVGRIGISLK